MQLLDHSFFRNLVSVLLCVLLVAVVFSTALAQSSELSFGIRPTKAFEGQDETYNYFSYRTTPGSTFSDEALVINAGKESVSLRIYVADGVTANNGGAAFTGFDERQNSGASSWVTLSASEVTLGPEEEKTIPFEVNIPQDAESGQHIAGLVVEAIPDGSMSGTEINTNADEAQFRVDVVRRVGVAVVLEVPGERVASLRVDNISLVSQGEEGATFAVELTNTGNVFMKTSGFFVVTNRTGDELITTIPLEFDTLLAGDTAIFYVPRPILFGDGEYLLSALMSYDGDKKATLEGVGMSIKNGQPKIEGVLLDEVFSSQEIQQIFEDPNANKNTLLIVLGVVGLLLAIGIAGFVYWHGGKKEVEKKTPGYLA